MKRVTVPCPICEGSGKCFLPDHLAETLAKVRKSRKPVTTDSLQEPGISNEAICNRLTDLEKHGLVKRAGKDGKRILWTATPSAK
jgi:DNA-binding HxlR family transcriptional regulator